MKITFVLPHADLSGGIRVVAIYAEKLQQRGHEVLVVSVPRQPPNITQKLKRFLKTGQWPREQPEPSHFDNLDVPHKVLECYRPITDKDLPDSDAVIATWWETAEWVHALSPEKGKKFYFVQHHEVHQGLPIERVKATYALPLKKITISQWLMDIMRNEYGESQVALVPNSVDSSFFNAPNRGRQPIPTVGFMYSTSHFKGCDIIIEALQQIANKLPALRILTFGACLPADYLPLPANTEFHFQPGQEKIRDIYASCDFWIFGSRNEGYGLPILEAMACRTPVIATPAGAAPELVEKTSGFLLQGHTSAYLSEGILRAFRLPDAEWQQMSQSARSIAADYTWDQATALFERALIV